MRMYRLVAVFMFTWVALVRFASANPPNGKAVLEAFYWDAMNRNYQTDPDGTGGWYTYLAKLAPRLRDMGFDGIWIPPPSKAAGGRGAMGYDLFDHYDIGQKFQKGSTGTRFGNQDEYLRMIATAHACGLEVYSDIVLNHMTGGQLDHAAPGDQHKTFHYRSFTGAENGRWPKSWLDFHPNPHHSPGNDEWRQQLFGPDICYHGRCCDQDCDHAGKYMVDHAREWFVWLRKQADLDGFRFDAVKHYPPAVVEDLLFNAMDLGRPENEQGRYFAVGEFVVGKTEQARIDQWAHETKDRCGAFDFAFREALLGLVTGRGFFDLGSLPNFQQNNRLKTVPFVNNHDTFRGLFSDSSGNGRNDHTHDLRNGDELVATIDPDDDWARLAYAAAIAIDGSPQFYFEDLFINSDAATRDRLEPSGQRTRKYVENLLWCHQKLNFKDGAYKVRFQDSPDLLVIERSAHAIIALNDNGATAVPAAGPGVTIETDFGANVQLHDYSGSTADEPSTDGGGRLTLPRVPAKSYCVWGRKGIVGGFTGHPRRTTQEFQMDDDLGDNDPRSLGYGGQLVPGAFRKAGAIWIKGGSKVKVSVFVTESRAIELQALRPKPDGAKADDQGHFDQHGDATATAPIVLEFDAAAEGYHQLVVRLTEGGAPPTRGFVKVEYEAPAQSAKF